MECTFKDLKKRLSIGPYNSGGGFSGIRNPRNFEKVLGQVFLKSNSKLKMYLDVRCPKEP